MTIELAAIFLKLNHDHNHAQLEGERGAQDPPMTGERCSGSSNDRFRAEARGQ